MAQSWEHLLFAHWRVEARVLRPLLPPQIPLDTFDGSAWIGVTPFMVSAFRLRGMPHLPKITQFPEVNVRTYTTIAAKPGIFFLSLDAGSGLAVAGARRAYRLPYFRARMSVNRRGGWIHYRSERTSADGPEARLAMRYRATGPVSPAPVGSLARWLVERYCLYTLDEQGAVHRADIQHPPWPLQEAEAEWEINSMATPYGLDPPSDQALLHFARRQDVVAWPLAPVD